MEESLATCFKIGKLMPSAGYQKGKRNTLNFVGLLHLQISPMVSSVNWDSPQHTHFFFILTQREVKKLEVLQLQKLKQEVPSSSAKRCKWVYQRRLEEKRKDRGFLSFGQDRNRGFSVHTTTQATNAISWYLLISADDWGDRRAYRFQNKSKHFWVVCKI